MMRSSLVVAGRRSLLFFSIINITMFFGTGRYAFKVRAFTSTVTRRPQASSIALLRNRVSRPHGTVARLWSTPFARRRFTRLHASSSASSEDASAFSKSRAPFSMPRDSYDDSVPSNTKRSELPWNELGLWTELVDCIEFESPTPVQQMVIPALLSDKTSMAFLAATGSGKTLSYCLPLLQQLKQAEVFGEADGSGLLSEASSPRDTLQRPRLAILGPTRELVVQILGVVKSLSHSIKLSSVGLYGGQEYGKERKKLLKHVDVVVATPGRLLKHWKDQNVFLGSLEYVVIDEMDTMLEQGFAQDLKRILYPLLYHKQPHQPVSPSDLDPDAPEIILTSATMTQAIQKMIGDSSDGRVNAKKHFRKRQQGEEAGAASPLVLPPDFQVLKAPGLHKAVPRLKQIFVDVGGADKMSLLIDIVSSDGSGAAIARDAKDSKALTMVFCNTAASCRAVQFALAEARIETLAYHGELSSNARSENLQLFRKLVSKGPATKLKLGS